MRRPLVLLLVTILIFVGCAPHRFFYYPTKNLYTDPHHLNLSYEMVEYPSLNGRKLFALVFRTDQAPKGLIVHFHGNYGNVSNHFIGSSFLIKHGFDVMIFDYQGYGGSEGTPSPKRTVEDGVASLRYATTINRNPKAGIGVLGQSLGGAVALAALAREPAARAAIIQSTFTSYRSIARDVLKRSAITWILYPFYPFFLPTAYDPIRQLEKLPPIPLLFILGTQDEVIPAAMTQQLFDRAKEPKTLWRVEGARHNSLRNQAGEEYDRRVAAFFSETLSTSND